VESLRSADTNDVSANRRIQSRITRLKRRGAQNQRTALPVPWGATPWIFVFLLPWGEGGRGTRPDEGVFQPLVGARFYKARLCRGILMAKRTE
jgi:hypothetical protein